MYGSLPLDWHTYKAVYLLSIWMEGLLYGLYVPLFIAAVCVMLKRKTADRFVSRTFLIGFVALFILITLHNMINAYRIHLAYSVDVRLDPKATVTSLLNWSRWENYATTVIAPLVKWTGELLITFRVYLVWGRKKWVIVLPILITLGSIGVGSTNIYWFDHRDALPEDDMARNLIAVYPLDLSHSVITTGLIAYKIVSRHYKSKQSGLHISAAISLVDIVRIIVESTLIYCIQVIVLACFFYLQYFPGSTLMQQILVPTIGICFALISIRTHIGQTRRRRSQTQFELPSLHWTTDHDEDEDFESESRATHNSRHRYHLRHSTDLSSTPHSIDKIKEKERRCEDAKVVNDFLPAENLKTSPRLEFPASVQRKRDAS